MTKNKCNTPILVANTEWELPEKIVKDIQAERMVNGLLDMTHPNVLNEEDLVGWAECVGYLMPETSKRPLWGQDAEIYLYCVRKYLEGKKIKIPNIGLPESLSDYQQDRLKELKRWIFKSRGGKEHNPLLSALKEVFFMNN